MFLAVQGGVVANPGTAMGIAAAKTSLTFTQAFARGVLCNWLVCMAGACCWKPCELARRRLRWGAGGLGLRVLAGNDSVNFIVCGPIH